jgi:hypothetical protein
MHANSNSRFSVYLLALALAFNPATAFPAMILLTPAEAEQLSITDLEWQKIPLHRSAFASGPQITFKDPTAKTEASGIILETTSPTDMWISFEENLAPVDPSTLEVKVCKNIFCRSLQDKLSEYLVGTDLRAKNISIPEGNFHITIAIADQQGNTTSQDYLLKVKNW